MIDKVVDLLYAIGALITGKSAQNNQNKTVSALLPQHRDCLPCWCRKREVGGFGAYCRSFAECRRPDKKSAERDKSSPHLSSETDSGGSSGAAGTIAKHAHDETLL